MRSGSKIQTRHPSASAVWDGDRTIAPSHHCTGRGRGRLRAAPFRRTLPNMRWRKACFLAVGAAAIACAAAPAPPLARPAPPLPAQPRAAVAVAPWPDVARAAPVEKSGAQDAAVV